MSQDISRFDQTVAIGLGMSLAAQQQARAQQRASLIAAHIAQGYNIVQATQIVDQWLWEQDAPARANDAALKHFLLIGAGVVAAFFLAVFVWMHIPGTHMNYCRTHWEDSSCTR